ncbi:MAG: cyclic nucleotide-binding domain-containing protein [Rhodospirillaceae bacterium]|nr:cyclic nucleotide-binding domain-containing protein [Rhodospirillales bacterium]MBT3904817.1 cyclic nucleotide-binding domain-containing protein [Rhodospirillaceae bacterium]MBT4702902.1 cyclic nucleotide-binding domain-containing protein [Rhodospirillaceae bacterium]MBT5035608.1 cyclic nucleotide-binding domain-containing protein [Rhodospirillaceae bacterium]MBT6219408.1 cyclic nucleotide-binding domain-containing protein [Rhodospirillaceae bacterium]
MKGSYKQRTFTDGEKIFSEGDRAGEAYLIRTGEIRIEKSVKGANKEIDIVGPGKIFGEMGVISDMNRMASAYAVGETDVICCHRIEMLKRIEDLDDFRREALQFLISYCQSFLPFEMMESRPDDADTRRMDSFALNLVREFNNQKGLTELDVFLNGLYKVLINYTERRLPPNLKT